MPPNSSNGTDMSRNKTPKEEPRDSPFPTPNSNRGTPAQPKRARDLIDDDDDSREVTVVRSAPNLPPAPNPPRVPNLGGSILTPNVQQPREAYHQELLSRLARPETTARSGSPDIRKRLRRDGEHYNGRRYAEGEDFNPHDDIPELRRGFPDVRSHPRRAGEQYNGRRYAGGEDFNARDDIPEPRGGPPDVRSRPRRAGVPYEGGRYYEGQHDGAQYKETDFPYNPFDDMPAYGKVGPSLRYEQLDDDQRRVVELAVKEGKNVCSVGGAGTGKSETCAIIVDELNTAGKSVAVVAPSGTAAVNVRAQTLHSFFGLGVTSNKGIADLIRLMSSTVRARLKTTKTLVIDEISMVSYETLDRMAQLARAARKDDRPFGGMQLIVFGDFCQLPPVKPWQHCYQCGRERELVVMQGNKRGRHTPKVWRCPDHGDISDSDKMWAFKSPQWDSFGFEYISLSHVHRQVDPTFLDLLDKLRHGKLFTPTEIALLQNHDCDVTNAVRLVSTRADAQQINSSCLNRLTTEHHRYHAQDQFKWNEDLHPELADVKQNLTAALSNHPYDIWVRLKIGQPVILQKNIDVAKGLVNGSQGVIDQFVSFDEAQRPRENTQEGGIIWQLRHDKVMNFMYDQGYDKLPVVKFNNVEGLVTIWPDCSISEKGYQKPYSLLLRTQIPLLAGWALTIHKAQGMTLEKAIVNVGACFQCGMAYVALSRVKTLGGLRVDGLRASNFNHAVDEEVKDFLEEKFGDNFD